MKIVGLVTEYNPFHQGHLHHLEAAKEKTGASHAIAVMSGHFLQRGEPALMNKWSRAKAAVEAGVDLVIELPTQFACSSAESFAYGAVSILHDLNLVDHLVFGSEAGTTQELYRIAECLNQPTEDFQKALRQGLDQGLSYPRARSQALEASLGFAHDFQPNNVLGIEYIRAGLKLKTPMTIDTIQRLQAGYMSTELTGTIASATAIRQALEKKQLETIMNFVPPSTYAILKAHQPAFVFPKDLGQLLLYKIRTMSHEDLKCIHDITEGLEMKIKKAAQMATDYPTLLEAVLSKRYTQTRIQRIFVKILLNIKKSTFDVDKPLYARVLAFNKKGQEILKRLRKTSNLPLITNINKIHLSDQAKDQLDLDILASDIYSLLNANIHNYKGGLDHLEMPRIIL